MPLFLSRSPNQERNNKNSNRRDFIRFTSFVTTSSALIPTQPAQAAPPIAIIAEELGYFPVTNREGETVYVAQSVKRTSSEQAKQLAQALREKASSWWEPTGVPIRVDKKELFGKEAWSLISYVECASKGYQANPGYCLAKQVDGYPAWVFPNGKMVSGERPLSLLAEEIGFRGFAQSLKRTFLHWEVRRAN